MNSHIARAVQKNFFHCSLSKLKRIKMTTPSTISLLINVIHCVDIQTNFKEY